MICFFCHGPTHPATGHAYTANVIACRRCFEPFHKWYRDRLRNNPIAWAALSDWARRDREGDPTLQRMR